MLMSFLCAVSLAAEAKIESHFFGAITMDKQDCPEFDNTKNFGPVRDQGHQGLCWTFQAAALAEENLCMQDHDLCGKWVSPYDVGRNYLNLLREDYYYNEAKGEYVQINDGGNGKTALDSISAEGVCEDTHAPYLAFSAIRGDSIDQNETIAAIFEDFYKEKLELIKKNQKDKLPQVRDEAIHELSKYLDANHLDGKNLALIFDSSMSKSDFLRKLVITKSCRENRQKLSPFKIQEEYFTGDKGPEDTTLQFMNFIRDAKKAGVSVGIALDMKYMMVGNPGNSTGKHGIVIDGTHYHEKKRQCLVHVRNSWGEDSNLQGWLDFKHLEAAIISGYYLEPNKE